MTVSTIANPKSLVDSSWYEIALDKDKLVVQNTGTGVLAWRVDEASGTPPEGAAVFTREPKQYLVIEEKLTGFLKMRALEGSTTIVHGDYAAAPT